MTWSLSIAGHQADRQYGSEEHKAHEQEVITAARDFVKTLRDHSVTQARFNGNTTGDVNLLTTEEPA